MIGSELERQQSHAVQITPLAGFRGEALPVQDGETNHPRVALGYDERVSKERQVFVTGASGCVGHYLVERLLEDPRNRIHALLRNPDRLRADLRDRVTVHVGALEEISNLKPLLAEMDAAILVATAWGGVTAKDVNVAAPLAIADALDPGRLERLIYFSTASLLATDGSLLEAARTHGTGYIHQKLDALVALSRHPLGDRIVPVFPTVVLGGDARHPYSHAMGGLPQLVRYLGLLRCLSLDGTLHVVHPFDIARAVVHLLDHDPPMRPVVLGNPALSVKEAIAQVAEAFGWRRLPQLDLTPFALQLPKIFTRSFTSWDRYCLEQRHFRLPVLDVPALLGPSGFESLAGIMASDPRLAARMRVPVGVPASARG